MISSWDLHVIMYACKMIRIVYYEDALFVKNRIDNQDLLLELGVNALLFYVLSTVFNVFSMDAMLVYAMDSTVTLLVVLGYQFYIDKGNASYAVEAFVEKENARQEAVAHRLQPKPIARKVDYANIWTLRTIVLVPYYFLFTDL